jgi:hypothetical protein
LLLSRVAELLLAFLYLSYCTIIFVNMSALNNETDNTKWFNQVRLDVMNNQEIDSLEVATVALTDIYPPFQ